MTSETEAFLWAHGYTNIWDIMLFIRFGDQIVSMKEVLNYYMCTDVVE